MVVNNKSSLITLVGMFILALSLPIATRLVQTNQDSRSNATEERSTSKISFKVAFEGVKPSYKCLPSLNQINLEVVNLTSELYQSDIGASISPLGETNQDGDQVFQVSNLFLNSRFNEVDTSNYLRIGSSNYLNSGMCFDGQEDQVDDSNQCNLDFSKTNFTVYDFSNYPLIPGDINQDGIVNTADFSIIKSNLDNSSDLSCEKKGDINYDGIVNSLDINILKYSLLKSDDEEIIDTDLASSVYDITPTPSNTPTPTATPTLTPTPTSATVPRSFTAETFKTGNYSMQYWLYLPKNYNKNSQWPLVVFLHGLSEFGTNINLLVKSNAFPGYIKNGADFNTVIIAPQAPDKDTTYGGKSYLEFIKEDLISYIVSNYNINTKKIALTGHSYGANGVVRLGREYPNFFSCLVPVSLCIKTTNWGKYFTNENIWAFHGSSDSECDPDLSKNFVSTVKSAGGQAKITLISGGGHVITKQVYIDKDAVDWMIQQSL